MRSLHVLLAHVALLTAVSFAGACGCGSDDLEPTGTLVPDIELLSPVGDEVWGGTQSVTWQTTLDPRALPGTVLIEMSADGGQSWTIVESAAPDTGTYSWDTTAHAAGRLVRVRVTATDSTGGVSTPSECPADLALLQHGWTRRLGGTGRDLGAAIVADPTGASYVAGLFQGTVDFRTDWGDASDPRTTAGSNEGFLTRIEPDGSYGYTRRIGGGGPDMLRDLALTPTGDVVASCTFESTVDFRADWGGGTDTKVSAGGNDVGITFVNQDGTYGWSRRLGSTAWDAGFPATDVGGAIYVAGNYTGACNFMSDWGGTDSRTSVGNSDAFVTQILADGSYGWTRSIGGSDADSALAAATDGSGNVYVAGYFSGSCDFRAAWGGGSDVHVVAGMRDAFLLKINADGTYAWTRRIGGTGEDLPASVAVNPTTGDVYVSGYFTGSVDFRASWGGATDTKASAGGRDVFITKVSADGSYGWTRRIGGASDDGRADYGGIAVDATGRVFAVAEFRGTVDFRADWGGDADTITSNGGSDVFVACILADGSYAWTRRIGGSGDDYPMHRGVAVGGLGRVFVGGVFRSTVNFAGAWAGTDSRTSAGSDDAFITMVLVGP